jgi:hypothetical protein
VFDLRVRVEQKVGVVEVGVLVQRWKVTKLNLPVRNFEGEPEAKTDLHENLADPPGGALVMAKKGPAIERRV